MKKHFLLLLAITLLVGCTNDDDSNINSKLIGEWNWIETSGGIGGWYYTPESTGEERSIIITNNIIKKYVDGELVAELNYTIDQVNSPYGGYDDLIIYENEIFDQRIVLDGNDLILYDYNVSDGFQSEYQRN
ncbi:MAG: hypothetical protein PSN34_02685 [Urechidicola sp.]|nr:hypothetical protein [Urechidicola sp.]